MKMKMKKLLVSLIKLMRKLVLLGWSHLFSKRVLDELARGMIGFHPTNLPYNRGRHPIIWSLVLGLKTSSSFLMNSIADGKNTFTKKN